MVDYMKRRSIKTWSYWVPGEPGNKFSVGHGHAILAEDGMFSACTDYGDYAYSWKYGRENEPLWFKRAFVGFGADYILDKMCKKTRFHAAPAVAWIKETLRETFQQERDELTGRFKPLGGAFKEEMDLLKQYDEYGWEEGDHLKWFEESTYFSDDCEILESFYDYPHSALAFANIFIPRLQDMVREDLRREDYVLNQLCA